MGEGSTPPENEKIVRLFEILCPVFWEHFEGGGSLNLSLANQLYIVLYSRNICDGEDLLIYLWLLDYLLSLLLSRSAV